MSIPAILERIAQIDQIMSPTPPAAAAAPAATGASSGTGLFSTALSQGIGQATPLSTLVGGSAGAPGSAGARALAAAQAQVGVAEQPPGSNDGPGIAQYRSATAGSGVGPWCAYFTSWAAAQAGAPLGEAGQGFGSVGALYGWAQRTGRATPAGPGVQPSPGDLIVWGGHHIGIVESVDGDGSIHTIEGNSSNAVSRRTYGPDGGGATGYVHLG
ncbi:MAG TPA: CHAP domain-containing protein [Solirubrobacteraceae bacterium]|nr:CHAP domain-containing protein [Solirubrobacteraceae bacterium]